MKRVRRWLFNGTVATSLLMGLATGALWIRSYGRDTGIFLQITPRWCTHLVVSEGKFKIYLEDDLDYPIWRPTFKSFDKKWDDKLIAFSNANYIPPSEGHFWGFGLDKYVFPFADKEGRPHGLQRVTRFDIPLWFLIGMMTLLPLSAVIKKTKHAANRKRGNCINCGYDLRATPGKCPECGTMPKKS